MRHPAIFAVLGCVLLVGCGRQAPSEPGPSGDGGESRSAAHSRDAPQSNTEGGSPASAGSETSDGESQDTSATAVGESKSDGRSPGADNASGKSDDKTDADEVSVKILDWQETQKLVEQHKGKVVVLDMWSTWCVPCIREFPNLVELHNEYGDRVACISVSCDYSGIEGEPPESYREDVLEFLRKQKATFDNVLSSVPSDKLYEKLDLGSIPAVLVYGPDGRLVQRFDNDEGEYGEEGFTYEEQVVPLVENLLEKQTAQK